MNTVLEIQGVSKRYAEDSPLVLNDIGFHADKNEFVAIVGPSGCGKSTLFNIVAGLLPPTHGTVRLDGETVTGTTTPRIGYVLQKDLLFPWLSILDNVGLGLEIQGMRRKEARDRARAIFADYKLEGYEDKYPKSLSGGMRQRAALMRTLVTDPEVILMDEAYKALDYPLKIQLESELLDTVRERAKTVVFVTHDIEEAVTLSDRVYVLKAHPGEVVNEIPIALSTDSTRINERRLAPEFNDYYEAIWTSIGRAPLAA